jgi:transcription elongation factor Elf1
MYDDLLGSKKKGRAKIKRINWDLSKYEDKPYCYNCGSIDDLVIVRDQLKGDSMEKDVKCKYCGCTWREKWDKDIELELKELLIPHVQV